MISPTLRLLFSFFPRRVGIPSFTIWSFRELEKYIKSNNGSEIGCHISVYEWTDNPHIDKMLFDFDGKSLSDAFLEVRLFVCELRRMGIKYIPVFSGNRGFHIYIPLKSVKYQIQIAKALLKQSETYIINRIESSVNKGVKSYKDRFTFKTIDTQKIGNVRSMIRIPGTLNLKSGALYCCFLPLDFDRMELDEIIKFAQNPDNDIDYNIDIDKLPKVSDLASVTNTTVRRVRISTNSKRPQVKVPSVKLLKFLLRPCIYEAILSSDPSHMIRVEFVTELMRLGYSPEQILEICKSLSWVDFDEEKTYTQIVDIFNRDLLPLSCTNLRQYVSCHDCGWNYYWIEEVNESEGETSSD